MFYSTGKLVDGNLVLDNVKEIDQSKLTSDCWLIQFNGIDACKSCEFLDTEECGGVNIRERLLKEGGL